jgi:hypothetical protein
MQQPLISTRVALTLIVALWGFAGWLDQPLDGDPTAVEAAPAEAPGMHLRCVTASTESATSQRASRPLLVSFAPDSNTTVDFESEDAALLRCHIVN